MHLRKLQRVIAGAHFEKLPGLLLLAGIGLLVAGCGKPVGAACAIEGSGFTSSDPCSTKCLSLWTVNCPDGSAVSPAVCAGRQSCEVGSCPAGQACYHFDDPFNEVSYCVPENVCAVPPSREDLTAWEMASRDRAAEVRAGYRKSPAETTTTPATP